jgi:hypothetical protein
MSDATLRSDGAGFYQLVARIQLFGIKIAVREQIFSLRKVSLMKSLRLSVLREQSPVNLNRCTRYTLAIFTVLSQT